MRTEVIKVESRQPDKEALNKAAEIIRKGGLVAFPTETVYGLAADYLNERALEKLYGVKERPKDKPFTVHISGFDDLTKLSCEITAFSKALIEKFWPGPLTLVLNTDSGGKVGVRMPRNKVALEFISACATPIVAPSANISGRRPPRSAEDVLKDLNGRIEMILDGGETEVGIESTVVDASVRPYRILREGAIKEIEIRKIADESA